MDYVDWDELEGAFKDHLEKQGIVTFGPVLKHYLQDARGYKLPHAPRQQPHGRRPGKRVLMTGIRALAKKKPELKLPSWNQMLGMEHHEVLSLFEKHFGEVKPAKGANQQVVRVVENDPNNADGFKREEEKAKPDAQTMQAAGRQGENLRVSQFDVSAALAGAKEKTKDRERLRPAARKPGRDVVDYHAVGHDNEGTRAERAGVAAPAARGNYNRNEESRADAEGAKAPTRPAHAVQRDPGKRPVPQPPRRLADRKLQDRQERQREERRKNPNRLAPNLRPEPPKRQAPNRVRFDNEQGRFVPREETPVPNAAEQTPQRQDAPKVEAPRRAPDGEATRAAREAGVPDTNNFRELGTRDRVPFREFHQNDEEVERGLQAARDEIGRNVEAGKNVDIGRIAGRHLDALAAKARKDGKPLNEVDAKRAAMLAYSDAEKQANDAGAKFKPATPEQREQRVARLAERYNIRHRGKPEGEAEEGRAREIDRHEKFREEGDANWQRGGRVRDKLKEEPAAQAGTATDAGAKNPPAGEETRGRQAQQMQEAGRRLDALNENGAPSESKQKALQAIHYGGFDPAAKRMFNGVINEVKDTASAKETANKLRRLANGKDDRQKKALMDAAEALSPMPNRLRPGMDQIAPGRFARDKARADALEKAMATGQVSNEKRLVNNDEDRGGINAGHMKTGKVGDQGVLLKHRDGDGVQEYLGYKIAQAMGLDKFHPVVGYRADEDRAIAERVGDKPAAAAGVDNHNAIVETVMRQEGVDKERATEIVAMLRAYDAILANTDRHNFNMRVGIGPDGKPNALFLIDDGFMGKGHQKGGKPNIRGGGLVPDNERRNGGKIALSPELREMLERLNDDFFKQHSAMFRAANMPGERYQQEMQERVQRFLDQGFVDYSVW